MKYLFSIILLLIVILMFPVWNKYRRIDAVLNTVARMEYGRNKCLDFSEKLKSELESMGIQSEVVIGKSPNTKEKELHAWVGIWIEPQTGQFTNNYTK